MSLSLFRYIVAIDQHQQNGVIDISIRDWKCTDCSYCDDEIKVIRYEIEYVFDTKIQIMYTIEYDDCVSDVNVCPECWIHYQVTVDPLHTIKPAKKSFYNRCQQQYWLKTMAMNHSDNIHH